MFSRPPLIPVLVALLLCALLSLAGCDLGATSSAGPTATEASGPGGGDVPDGSSAAQSDAVQSAETRALRIQAEDLVAKMTLKQKAAQVLLLDFPGTVDGSETLRELLAESPPGGLMVSSYNVETQAQIKELLAFFQDKASQADLPVRLLIAVDQEGGPVQRIKEVVSDIPGARTLGTQGSTDEAAEIAAETAEELLSLGVNMNLAPVADVVSDERSFLFQRTYSNDPAQVAEYVTTVLQAFRDDGMIGVLKHFPGHGSAPGDSHKGAVISTDSEEEFENTHLVPFRAGVEAGADAVLVSHVIVKAYDPKYPATSSKKVIQGLLREKLGFDGVVISDALEMDASRAIDGKTVEFTPQAAADTAVLALRAGCDMLISAGTTSAQMLVLDTIVKAVENGDLELERLDEAVARVLELKLKYGLTF